MAIPRVQVPPLRAFLGAIALTKTTAVTAVRALYKLQGGLTQNDVDVRDVVNALIDAFDTSASSPGAIGGTTPAAGTFTTLKYSGKVVATDGAPPNLGRSAVVMSADANHTLTSAEMANHVLTVTSGVALTATRNVVAPLVDGAIYRVKNSTTGGQSIQIIGASGTGATIATGATETVVCNGTNWDKY